MIFQTYSCFGPYAIVPKFVLPPIWPGHGQKPLVEQFWSQWTPSTTSEVMLQKGVMTEDELAKKSHLALKKKRGNVVPRK